MYLHTRNITRLPPLPGRHPTQKSCRAFILRGWNMGLCFGIAHKKSRSFPCENERGNLSRKKAQALHPFSFPSQENDTASKQVLWLGSPRDPCAFPVSPSGVFPSRAPLTAAGQHRHRTCFPAMKRLFYGTKSRRTRHPLSSINFSYIISE